MKLIPLHLRYYNKTKHKAWGANKNYEVLTSLTIIKQQK